MDLLLGQVLFIVVGIVWLFGLEKHFSSSQSIRAWPLQQPDQVFPLASSIHLPLSVSLFFRLWWFGLSLIIFAGSSSFSWWPFNDKIDGKRRWGRGGFHSFNDKIDGRRRRWGCWFHFWVLVCERDRKRPSTQLSRIGLMGCLPSYLPKGSANKRVPFCERQWSCVFETFAWLIGPKQSRVRLELLWTVKIQLSHQIRWDR